MLFNFSTFNKINEALIGGENSEKISIDLRGESGNAYYIMALAQRLAKQLKEVDPEKYNIKKILDEMMSSDYKHLVETFEKYFGDFVNIYNADVLDEQ